jgi:hypothetical protein
MLAWQTLIELSSTECNFSTSIATILKVRESKIGQLQLSMRQCSVTEFLTGKDPQENIY